MHVHQSGCFAVELWESALERMDRMLPGGFRLRYSGFCLFGLSKEHFEGTGLSRRCRAASWVIHVSSV